MQIWGWARCGVLSSKKNLPPCLLKLIDAKSLPLFPGELLKSPNEWMGMRRVRVHHPGICHPTSPKNSGPPNSQVNLSTPSHVPSKSLNCFGFQNPPKRAAHLPGEERKSIAHGTGEHLLFTFCTKITQIRAHPNQVHACCPKNSPIDKWENIWNGIWWRMTIANCDGLVGKVDMGTVFEVKMDYKKNWGIF